MKNLKESLLDDEEELLDNSNIEKIIAKELKNDKGFPTSTNVHFDRLSDSFTYEWCNEKLFKLLNNFGIKDFIGKICLASRSSKMFVRKKKGFMVKLNVNYRPSSNRFNTDTLLSSKNYYEEQEAIALSYKLLKKLKDNPKLLMDVSKGNNNFFIEDII